MKSNADRRIVLQSGWSERGDHFVPLGFPTLDLLNIRKLGLLRSSTCSESRQQDVAGSLPVGGDRASELEMTSSYQCGRCLLGWSSPCLLPAHGIGFNVKKIILFLWVPPWRKVCQGIILAQTSASDYLKKQANVNEFLKFFFFFSAAMVLHFNFLVCSDALLCATA